MTALQTALQTIDANATGKHAAMARGLMRAYDHYWTPDPNQWTVEAVEEEFCTDIYNLATGRKSRTFKVAGKKDLLVHDSDGRRWVVDHKTTSLSIEQDGIYFRQLAVDSQASLYLLSEHLMGREVHGACWDIIKKPNIRMKRIPQKERAEIASLGTYQGWNVSDDTKDWVIAGGEKSTDKENEELYELRIARLAMDSPSDFFCRHNMFRLEPALIECAEKLWVLGQEILACRRTGRWITNTGACMDYGTPCQYLGICSGYDTPESVNWVQREERHSELDTIVGDGLNVLSNSRLACFLTCRKKHYFRYELGIERADREESEALYFGSLIHTALEQWWLKQRE